MKIVCDACGAKYSIADDKVQGKVFKIRCKKCSNIIVVRGTAGAAAAAEEPAAPQYDQKETRVFDYNQGGGGEEAGAASAAPGGDDAVWHVVIDQEQVGPMTAAEVQERFAGGQIDAESYIWREGFGDWQPLSAVDTFAHLAAGGGGGLPGGVSASMFGEEGGTVRSDPHDLFATGGHATAGVAATAQDDGGSELFSGRSSGGAGAAVGGARLRGERNENSVLFSLNNLAQLASDSPRASAASAAPVASSSMSMGAGMAGHGGGEGSGLIDIRSMASAYLGERSASRTQNPPMGAIGSVDDLPVFASTAFSEPVVLMPTGGSRGQNNKLLIALVAGVGLLAAIAIVLVIVVLKGGSPAPAAPQVAKEGTGTKPEIAPDGSDSDKPIANPGTDADKPTPDKPIADKPTPDKPIADKPDRPAAKPVDKPADKPTDRGDRDKPRDKPVADKPVADKPEEPSGGGCDEVSCLLNNNAGSCCAKYRKSTGSSKPTGGGNSDLPEGLDRSAISDGLAKLKGRVMACGSKSAAKGNVSVKVKVSADGKVTGATVSSSPDGALGSCVSSAVKGGTFKKTQTGGSFSYTWKF